MKKKKLQLAVQPTNEGRAYGALYTNNIQKGQLGHKTPNNRTTGTANILINV